MNKYLLLISMVFLFTFNTIDGIAQQESQFSHNMFNILSFNPAVAGMNDQICLNAISRQQWMGFKETNLNGETYSVNPQTLLLGIDGNVNVLRGGIGAVIFKDKLGHEENIGFKIGYSYKHYLGQGQLSAGIMAGFLNKTINYSGFFPIDQGDPLLQGNKESDMVFDISFGAFYNEPGSFYAGISSSQLLQSESDFGSSLGSPKLKRHYFITGGYQYTIPSAPEFELHPSALIKTDFVSTQIDLNCLVWWNSQFWTGLSYRTIDAVVFFAGARPLMNSTSELISPIGIGVSYDYTTSAMGSQGRSNGSLEVFLNYCFRIVYVPPVSSYKNVRFL